MPRPWICHRRTLTLGGGRTEASPRRDQSLRGHTSRRTQRASHGIARRLSPRPWSEAAGEGFAVMSGSSHRIAPMQGNCSPDKEFRLGQSPCRHEARTISSTPTVHLGVGRRVVSEGSIANATTSLLIVRTRRIITTSWYRGILGVSSIQPTPLTTSPS